MKCHVEEVVELDSDMEEGMDIGILQASNYTVVFCEAKLFLQSQNLFHVVNAASYWRAESECCSCSIT